MDSSSRLWFEPRSQRRPLPVKLFRRRRPDQTLMNRRNAFRSGVAFPFHDARGRINVSIEFDWIVLSSIDVVG
jgi:hypothetical protein